MDLGLCSLLRGTSSGSHAKQECDWIQSVPVQCEPPSWRFPPVLPQPWASVSVECVQRCFSPVSRNLRLRQCRIHLVEQGHAGVHLAMCSCSFLFLSGRNCKRISVTIGVMCLDGCSKETWELCVSAVARPNTEVFGFVLVLGCSDVSQNVGCGHRDRICTKNIRVRGLQKCVRILGSAPQRRNASDSGMLTSYSDLSLYLPI